MTSYGRNKNHDDEIKKPKRRPIIAPAIAVRLLKNIFELKFYQDSTDKKLKQKSIPIEISDNEGDNIIDLLIYKNHYTF